jgi:hypothetical protein
VLARDVPRDEAGLLRVPGIGAVKVERYGAALLQALADEVEAEAETERAGAADGADGTGA